MTNLRQQIEETVCNACCPSSTKSNRDKCRIEGLCGDAQEGVDRIISAIKAKVDEMPDLGKQYAGDDIKKITPEVKEPDKKKLLEDMSNGIKVEGAKRRGRK